MSDHQDNNHFPDETIRKMVKTNETTLVLQNLDSPFEKVFTTKQQNQLRSALNSIQNYTKASSFSIQHQKSSINTLSSNYIIQNKQIGNRVSLMVECIFANRIFLNEAAQAFTSYYSIIPNQNHTQQIGHGKITNLLLHCVRQWGKQRQQDSERYYMKKIGKLVIEHGGAKRVLVGGSGMGRILHELKQILNCEIMGNQSSPQMYILGQYFLNGGSTNKIHPYIHNFSNCINSLLPYKELNIPDINVKDSNLCANFGNFTQMYLNRYKGEQRWDVVITSLISEQITNVFELIQTVYSCLTENGLWVDHSTGCFDNHVIPLTYSDFDQLLKVSQFQTLQVDKQFDRPLYNPEIMMYDERRIYYRVMRKKNTS